MENKKYPHVWCRLVAPSVDACKESAAARSCHTLSRIRSSPAAVIPPPFSVDAAGTAEEPCVDDE